VQFTLRRRQGSTGKNMMKVSEDRIAWGILGPERKGGREGGSDRRMEKITRI
jgi:hypothetical protein